jgi:CBS domain-containing protein
MKTVRQILQHKGNESWWVDPDSVVYDALKLMAEKNVGAVLVRRENRLVGIFSERDYARRIILKGKHSKDTLVREVMTDNPICVHPSQTIEECMTLMTRNHIRHLPVVDENGLIGVISIGDVVEGIISEHKGTISDLENFITGGKR